MKIHHLNCATCCPFGGHFIDGMTPGIGPSKMVCHTLLVESDNGLILIDTGLGLNDVYHPQRLPLFFRTMIRPLLLEHETAYMQIKQLGFNPMDVRHIILTHLDLDHAGGIEDFPNATVHVMEREKRAALLRKTFISRSRYNEYHLIHSDEWRTYQIQGEKWYGFEAVQNLTGLPPEILLIPLYGHTEGHAGVAIKTDKGWLLHAGDSYFYRGELDETYHCTPGLRILQKLVETNREKRIHNQRRLRELSQNYKHEVTIFSAHDPVEYLSMRESSETHLYSTQTIARNESTRNV